MEASKRIIIVDDHQFNRDLLCAAVRQLGHDADAFESGREALDHLDNGADLVLLDVMMPVMDGFEVARTIRATPAVADVPIIMVTALDSKTDRLKSVEAGANDFISKPVDMTELKVRMNSLLRMKEAQDEIKRHKESLEETVRRRTAELEKKNRQLEREVIERKRSEEALKESRANLAEAQQVARMGSWTLDLTGDRLIWSDEIFRIFGLDAERFSPTYDAFLNAVHPDDRDAVQKAVSAALAQKKVYDLDHRILLPDGAERIVHEYAKVTCDASGAPVRMVGTVQDITERRQIEAELKRLYTAIEESINIIFITDVHGRIEYVNPMFEKVTGYSSSEALGNTPRLLSSGDTPRQIYDDLWAAIKNGKTWRGQFKNMRKNGKYYWWKGLISPIRSDDSGAITHFLAIQEDITEKVLAEKKAAYLSTHDPTTGRLNRRTFIRRVEDRVEKNGRGVIILTNVDGFKLINDTHGHTFADEFLKRIAGVINEAAAECAPETPIFIGRMGRDEIALCIQGKDGMEGLEIAESVRRRVERFRFTKEEAGATLSAGIVEFPAHGGGTKELLAKADSALFRAKRYGKNRCHLYDEKDGDLESARTKFRKREMIIKAIEDGRLEPWFQPILDLKSNAIHHYEALARMTGEDGAVILPGEFIPAAESLGLIRNIDRIITAKAIQHQAEQSRKGRDFSVSVNISGKHLGDEALLNDLRKIIREAEGDPSKLIFEITETAAVEEVRRATEFIQALKSEGCRFSLDDFGVGYTSFLYLREMQVDYIKIDGMFIRRLNENKQDQGIVNAISTIAKNMRIKSIAEFVEKEETLRLLKAFEVDYAQGFLIGRPEPPAFFEKEPA